MEQKLKLQLILDHAKEYYKNMKYYFFNGNRGFITYWVKNDLVTIEDIFIPKEYRGKSVATSNLKPFIDSLKGEGYDPKGLIGYVQKGYEHSLNSIGFLEHLEFKFIGEDSEKLYFKRKL